MAKRNIFVESMRAELAGQVPEHLVEPLMRQLFGRKIARRFRRRFHCGAHARSTGKPCRAHALENGRCKRGTRAHRRRAACPLDELAKQEAIGLAPPDRAIFILGLRGLAASAAAPQRPPRDRSAFRTSRVRVGCLDDMSAVNQWADNENFAIGNDQTAAWSYTSLAEGGIRQPCQRRSATTRSLVSNLVGARNDNS